MSIEIEIPRYTIIRQIGSGGMAVVYLAKQEGLEREVAVKVLKQSLTSGGEEFKKRFQHEGRILAQLEHENIVKIYDIGATDTGIYMVMEYLRGGTLTERMQSGDVQLQDIIRICAQVGLALHIAHRKSIIHRDLKPSNIMFRDPVTPVLTDFGIARKIDMDLTLTETGMMIGTPQYMSPEQIQGKAVDARSDIYSLGLMFYRLLTGALPFNATDPIALAMQQIQEEPPPLPPELSELQPVMDLMLAKEPQDRYQSTLDFCNHLRSISLTGEQYATELSGVTRIFSAASLKEPGSTPSVKATVRSTAEPSSVSRGVSSISTAVSVVFSRKKNRYLATGIVLAVAASIFIAFKLFSTGLTESELKRLELELRTFNAQVSRMDIFAPEGANATETLRGMQALASDNSGVRDAADELADIYEGYAHKALSENDLDQANDLIKRGLAFAPQHKGLTDIGEGVVARIKERDRLARIERLLDSGNSALTANNLLPPSQGNAYDAFREVRSIDLQNAQAEAGLSEIQRRLSSLAREAWENAGRDEAKSLALEGLSYFAESQLLLDLQAEIELEEQAEDEQQQLEQSLKLADEQYTAGNIVDPAGSNALESYRRALEIRPEDPTAMEGLERIAEHYLEIAQTRFRDDAFQESIEAVASGLKAVPDHPGLLLAQNAATNRLDVRNREIQTRLQLAQRLVASGRLIPGQPGIEGGAENAFAAFNRVLEVDPGNVQAIEGLAVLPDRVSDAVAAFERQGQLDKAKALLLAAARVYVDNASHYQKRIQSIDQRMAEREANLQMMGRLAAIDDLMEQRPLTPELIGEIANSLLKVSGDDRYQLEVADRLGRFIAIIESEAEVVSNHGNDNAALALLEHGLIFNPGHPSLVQAKQILGQRQLDRAEEERQRIASMSGVLAIDATPWARVVEVRNSKQALQDLPEHAETPLSLSLLEGNYTVILTAADGSRTFELSANVRRQEVETVRPETDLISAQEYFERSGW